MATSVPGDLRFVSNGWGDRPLEGQQSPRTGATVVFAWLFLPHGFVGRTCRSCHRVVVFFPVELVQRPKGSKTSLFFWTTGIGVGPSSMRFS